MAFKSTTQKAPIPKISHLYHLFEQFRYFLLLIFRTIGRRSLEVRDQCEFFVHRTRVTRNLQSSKIRFIFGFYSCDKKLIKVNGKPTFYCSLHCCKL